MNKIEKLLNDGIIFNLYRNKKTLEDGNYYDESILNEFLTKYGNKYLDHLYAFAYSPYLSNKIANKKMFSFLDAQIGKGYKDVLFQKGKHHPNILLYNSAINKVIGIGVGRKNRIFILKYDEPKTATINDDISYFTKLDFANIISKIIKDLEETMDYHYDLCALDEDENESDIASEISENMDSSFYNIKIAIPTISDEIGDISPGDF